MPQASETDTTRLDHLHSRKQARESRRRIEATIENLIALLDTIDGDPDLEDGTDDEPSLCGLTVSWPSPEDREPDGDEIDDDDIDERWSQPVFLDGSGCGSQRTF